MKGNRYSANVWTFTAKARFGETFQFTAFYQIHSQSYRLTSVDFISISNGMV